MDEHFKDRIAQLEDRWQALEKWADQHSVKYPNIGRRIVPRRKGNQQRLSIRTWDADPYWFEMICCFESVWLSLDALRKHGGLGKTSRLELLLDAYRLLIFIKVIHKPALRDYVMEMRSILLAIVALCDEFDAVIW